MLQQAFWLGLENTFINYNKYHSYHLVKLIGCGGYGGVFRAHEILFDDILRDVAIKVIAPPEINLQTSAEEQSQQRKRLFKQQWEELQLAVTHSHSHLVRGHTVGFINYNDIEFLFLVMELATGNLFDRMKGTLRPVAGTLQWCSPSPQDAKDESEFPLTQWEILEIIRQTATGLEYLHHREHKVHRDLKPDNILWCGDRWKLSDFGLVRQLDNENITHDLELLHRAYARGYSAPEVFADEGSVISTAGDMWSLGILTVALLQQGRFPYDCRTESELLEKMKLGQVTLPTAIPDSLAPIIENCLLKNRKDRWSAVQVLAHIQAVTLLSADPHPVLLETHAMVTALATQFQQIEPVLRRLTSADDFDRLTNPVTTAPASESIPEPLSPPAPAPVQSATPKATTPDTLIETLPGGVELELIKIPAGSFLMGSSDDPAAADSEKPQHEVWVPEFYAGKTPITLGQYEAVMKNNSSQYFKGDPHRPVDSVSWNDAQEFCKKLREMKAKSYRLPSEAEWEYACRAGTTTRYYFGQDMMELGKYAWFGENSENQTHAVGDKEKEPNPWGLYDMPGNVWEWCEDRWHESYQGAPTDGSAWVQESESTRVLRGGCWADYASSCRSSCRDRFNPDLGFNGHGFRVVMSP